MNFIPAETGTAGQDAEQGSHLAPPTPESM